MTLLKRLKCRLQGRPFLDPASLKACGRGVVIKGDCEFFFPERIALGDYVYVGPHAYWSGEGGVAVGRNVIFGPRTSIWTANHDWRGTDCLPYGVGTVAGPVTIEDNVWVCYGAMIVPGVTIGEGAIVAMGAVVTRDVAPCTVVGGNPAVPVAKRDRSVYEELKKQGKTLLVERNGADRTS